MATSIRRNVLPFVIYPHNFCVDASQLLSYVESRNVGPRLQNKASYNMVRLFWISINLSMGVLQRRCARVDGWVVGEDGAGIGSNDDGVRVLWDLD